METRITKLYKLKLLNSEDIFEDSSSFSSVLLYHGTRGRGFAEMTLVVT